MRRWDGAHGAPLAKEDQIRSHGGLLQTGNRDGKGVHGFIEGVETVHAADAMPAEALVEQDHAARPITIDLFDGFAEREAVELQVTLAPAGQAIDIDRRMDSDSIRIDFRDLTRMQAFLPLVQAVYDIDDPFQQFNPQSAVAPLYRERGTHRADFAFRGGYHEGMRSILGDFDKGFTSQQFDATGVAIEIDRYRGIGVEGEPGPVGQGLGQAFALSGQIIGLPVNRWE